MSRFRNILFVFMAIAAPLLGLVAAGLLVSFIVPAYDLPYISPIAKQMSDSDLLLAAAGAPALVVVWFFAAWLLSLDSRRQRRPVIWLLVLGLGPGAVLGGLVWMAALEYGFNKAGELTAFATLTLLLTAPLALVPDALGALGCRMMAGIAQGTKNWKQEAFFTKAWRLFSPSNPTLRRRAALADFRGGHHARALDGLKAEHEAGARDATLLAALNACAKTCELVDLEILTGEQLLEAPSDKWPTEVLESDTLRRRLTDLYSQRHQWLDALRVFRPTADRTNSPDLEQIGKLLFEAGLWDELMSLLPALEAVDTPPRMRLEGLCHRVVGRLRRENREIARYFAGYLQRQKRSSEESDVLERMLDQDPQDQPARQRIIDIYRQTILTEKLIGHLRHFCDQPGATAELQVELAELLLSSNQLAEAAERARQGAAQSPDDFRFPYIQANTALRRDAHAEARELAAMATELASRADNTKGLEALRALDRKINQAAARYEVGELEAWCGQHPGDAEKRLRLVDMLLASKRVEKAISELDELLKANPAAAPEVMAALERIAHMEAPPYMAVGYLADLYIAANNMDRAHELYDRMANLAIEREPILEEGARRILEKQPTHVPSLLRLSTILRGRKQWRPAGELLRQALATGWQPDGMENKVEALETLVSAGDLTFGLPLAQELHEAEGFNPRWLVMMAQLHLANDQVDEALKALARAKELDPGNNLVFRMLEETRRKQREGRVSKLRAHLENSPEDGEALEELGDHLDSFGKYEEALRSFQRASQCTKSDDQRRLRCTKLASTMMRRRMFDTALETMREVPLSLMEERAALGERKRIFYEVAEEFESNNRLGDALELYKQVFKVDAGFRHVMEKIERFGA